ncbi:MULTISPECIES: substrate-binding domain-containing protein [unclassified Microbacterium]|uniref:substrate-binding domain-containing protein n=1 Tax=unclassified Microbacterium TaxID=2609290 RepID=UPI000C2CAFAB|nr:MULTISPECIES: substrate-binding domain-containing protein [unclassified Microbacterium]
MSYQKSISRRQTRALRPAALVAIAGVAVLLAGCGSGGATVGSSSAPTSSGMASECGEVPNIPPNFVDGADAELTDATKELFSGYPGPVRVSPYADMEAKPGPWRIGFSSFAPNSAWVTNLFQGMEDAFQKAKELGLVEGELEMSILPDAATQTPADQIAGFQSLVRDGVDGVIMLPIAADPLAPALTEAGEAGIPTVIMGNTSPSEYAISANPLNIAGGTAETIKALGGKGDIVVVRGMQGAAAETYGYDQIKTMIDACPDLNIIGEINGNWNNATTKTAMQQFLVSHPGQIDGVLQNGIMAQGVIQAFEQVGRDVPIVNMVGGQAGDLSYFADHLDEGYVTGGSAYNGNQQAWAAMRILLNTLAGNGPKVTDIPIQVPVVTKDNVKSLVPEGATLNDLGDPLGSPNDFAPQSYLDQFFTTTGGPGKDLVE